MTGSQFLFLLLIFILGICVVFSYQQGIKRREDIEVLWGGLSKKLRKIYTISILVSTVAFFVSFIYILLLIGDGSYPFFFIIYTVMLIASAFWMPLVNRFVKTKSDIDWYLMRTSLIFTGLSSFFLFFFLLNIQESTIFYYIALASSIILTLHTGILDAIVWPKEWRKS